MTPISIKMRVINCRTCPLLEINIDDPYITTYICSGTGKRESLLRDSTENIDLNSWFKECQFDKGIPRKCKNCGFSYFAKDERYCRATFEKYSISTKGLTKPKWCPLYSDKGRPKKD